MAVAFGLLGAALGLARIGQASPWLLATVLVGAALTGFGVYYRGLKPHPRFETLLLLYGGTWLLVMSFATVLSQTPRL